MYHSEVRWLEDGSCRVVYPSLSRRKEYGIIDYLENLSNGGKLRPKDIILFIKCTLESLGEVRTWVDTVIIDPFYLLYHGDENDIVQVCDCLESIKDELTYNHALGTITRNVFLFTTIARGIRQVPSLLTVPVVPMFFKIL